MMAKYHRLGIYARRTPDGLLCAEPHGAAGVATDRGRDYVAQRSLHGELERLGRRPGALLGDLGEDVLVADAAELRAGIAHLGLEIPGAILVEAPGGVDDPAPELGIETAALRPGLEGRIAGERRAGLRRRRKRRGN